VAVPQKLTKAEREHLCGQGTPAQAGGDLRTQQLGRRARDPDPQVFRVQDAAHEPVPAFDPLDFVQKEMAGLSFEGGKLAVVGTSPEPLLNVAKPLYRETPATLSIKAPADATKVSGQVPVPATTTAAGAVASQFYLDGQLIGEDEGIRIGIARQAGAW
jgi:hypothetical protein